LQTPCNNRHATNTGIGALLPNNTRLQATHEGLSPIWQLPTAAQQINLFPQYREPLLSTGLLCDHGCTALFTREAATIQKDNAVILHGPREPHTGLWKIPLNPALPLPTPAPQSPVPSAANNTNHMHSDSNYSILRHQANSAYHQPNQAALVSFLHATAGSPVPSTWVRAIHAGHFATWPGLTAELVNKHLQPSLATAKGHLDQQRQNIRSTQAPTNLPVPDTISSDTNLPAHTDGSAPIQENTNIRTHHIFAVSHDLKIQIASNLTGRFPTTAFDGHQYVLIIYDYDSHSILAETMKNRLAQEHLRAYNKLYHYLCARGFRPLLLQKLDNEASALLKNQMRLHNIDFQLVPPNMHRRNAAERAFRTIKNTSSPFWPQPTLIFP
jgi:hypothetical protein